MAARAPGSEGAPDGDVEVSFEDQDGSDAGPDGPPRREAADGEGGEGGENGDANARRRRRRGRRGGRRNRRQDGTPGQFGDPEGGFDLLEPEVAEAIADFGGPRLGEDIPTGEQPELSGPVTETDHLSAPTEATSPAAPDEISPENLPVPSAGFDAPERPIEPRRSRRRTVDVPPPPDFGPVDPPEPLQALDPDAALPVSASALSAAAPEPTPA
ncbi:hypothetical protein CH341_31425, partial [Rhodoplanes roseus]